MRQEILVAIFIGITLGLMITFGFYQNAERSRVGQNTITDQLVNTPQAPEDEGAENSSLVINNPAEDLLTDQEEMIIAGSAGVNNFLVVLVNDREYISTADASGNFSVKVTLEPGGNLIEVTSLDEDGRSVSQQRSVIYEAKN